ncbi:hypothetical protein Tco_0262146 [Tanacetum coccineum]
MSGPFTITEVYPYGTAKLSHADGSNFKVNCHRLKHYYGGDTPPLDSPNKFFEASRVRLIYPVQLELLILCMDKTKNHKKTVKNGQARTRESEEHKRSQRCKAKARKSQPPGTEDNSRARLQDGRERLVKSSFSLTHSQAKATWLWKKAQGELGFTLGSLREVTQGSHQGLPAWQSV